MFDFRLQVFEMVVRLKSFTAAAHALFVSQPAISKHIKALEEHWGIPLFIRRGNEIQLTAAGERLHEHVMGIMQKYAQMDFAMQEFKGSYSGTLRIAASTTIAQYILPKYLSEFKAQHPEIIIHLESGNTTEVENLVRQNQVDFGLSEGDTFHHGLKYDDLWQDDLLMVCRKGSQWKKQWEAKGLEALPKMPFVFRETGSGTLVVIEHYLQNKGVRLNQMNIQMMLGSTEAIKSYLRHTDVCAFLPQCAIEDELLHRLEIIDAKQWHIKRPLFLVQHGQQALSDLGGLFLRFLKS
ncbi:LysR substrate-binding domain-containing protein [Persicobacter psychrovividus]|uniref:Transcriptional regulator n=1 Tax=Persicobacter psychrovividus TaxID=387638 RepID=A0ABN6LAX7_9BACT|nr:transcriptional regulator [Persicobacter psychrovividus]